MRHTHVPVIVGFARHIRDSVQPRRSRRARPPPFFCENPPQAAGLHELPIVTAPPGSSGGLARDHLENCPPTRWVRFVNGERSARAHFPASCAQTRFWVGFDWVRFLGRASDTMQPRTRGDAENRRGETETIWSRNTGILPLTSTLLRVRSPRLRASAVAFGSQHEAPPSSRVDRAPVRRSARVNPAPWCQKRGRFFWIVASPFARAASNRRKRTYRDEMRSRGAAWVSCARDVEPAHG
jgi:hypothetical protein